MNDFSHIFNDVKRESLTDSERVSMRNALLAHIAEHPAKLPLSMRFAEMLRSLGDAFGSQRESTLRFVPATLAMVLVVGLGTAYAAEGALPGQPLYAVKLNLNEPLKGAIAVSESAEASWQTERLERRLAEAEVLLAKGELSPKAQAQLEAQIDATAERFQNSVDRLARNSGEAAVAAAQSDLEASLIGHAEVLVSLSLGAGEDRAVQPIIRTVLSKAEAVQSARASVEAAVAARKDGKDIRAAALQKKEIARDAVTAVRAKAASPIVATTTAAAEAEESAAAAEEAITAAEEQLREGEYGAAFSTFQKALRTVQTVEVHLDANERLNADVRILTREKGSDADAALMMTSQPADQ